MGLGEGVDVCVGGGGCGYVGVCIKACPSWLAMSDTE